ncbi:MAG: hypothetical protein CL607_20075 [Anaerolineaceae bacterium]|nr:hypothetical protein [Anaerolineaceae bacterium]
MKTKFSFLLVLLLMLVVGIQPAVAKKPLTTITFDELPEHVIMGSEYIKGATIEYLGVTGFAIFGDGSAPGLDYIQDKCLWGYPKGEMMITFDKPTSVLEFGVAIATNDMLAHTVIIDLYKPGNGSLRDSVTLSTAPKYAASETLFTYHGAAIERVVIRFTESEWDYGFMIDNIVFHG